MTWFTNWFGELTNFQQILACAAIPATVILALQTLLLLFGAGGHSADHGEIDHDFDHGFDHDLSHDFDHDHDFSHVHCPDCDHSHDFAHGHDHSTSHDGAHHSYGVRLFTVRGLVAMFAVGGWLGIAAVDLGAGEVLSAVIAAASGVLALLLVAYILKLLLNMQEDGNLDSRNAIAQTAKVYLTVPAGRKGTGKVMLMIQERLVEMDAVTDHDNDIKTDCMVQVVSATDNLLVVRPLNDDGTVE